MNAWLRDIPFCLCRMSILSFVWFYLFAFCHYVDFDFNVKPEGRDNG